MKNCTYFDSELTQAGTPRKKIYIPCSNGLDYEAKLQALKDYNSQKQSLNKVEKIKPFKRCYGLGTTAGARESYLEHREWADLAVQYMRYIL